MITSVISMSFVELKRTEPLDTLIHVMSGTGIPKASQANSAIWVWLTISSTGPMALTLGGSEWNKKDTKMLISTTAKKSCKGIDSAMLKTEPKLLSIDTRRK